MNREIKFRAWEPLNRKIHYFDGFAPFELEGEKKRFALPIGHQGVRDSNTAMNLDAIELMQYTGLKDKNGREIFEGDLIGEEGFTVPVEYHDAQFTVGNAQALISWIWARERREFETEVIGNIYENPELLEQ